MIPLRRPPTAVLTVLTVVAGAVLVASIAVSLFSSSRVEWNGGCGDDGREYCRMARGLEARRPWSRRFLLPSIVRVLDLGRDHAVVSFLVANVLALAIVAAAAALLTLRLAQMLAADRSRARWAAALSAAVTSLFPFAFHWTLFYPVLVDDFSLAFAVAWFLLATSTSPSLRWAAVGPAGLAVISRESWLLVIACGVIARVAVERRRSSVQIGAVTLAVIAGCGAWAFTRKGLPNPSSEDIVPYAEAHLRRWFSSVYGLKELTWLVLFSLGLLPLLLLRKLSVVAALWRAGSGPRALVVQLVAVTTAVVFVSVALGSDVHRYLFAAAPFLTALIMATVARYPRLDLELSLCFAGSLAVWSPFAELDGSRARYLQFFSPQYLGLAPERLRTELRIVAPVILLWTILALVTRRIGAKPGSPRRP
jgi:hypothetical protein